MKRGSLLTIGIVVLLVVPGLSMAAVQGSPSISVHLADGHVAPGEETTLDVVILNEGEVQSGSATNPSLNSQVTTARGVSINLRDDDAPFDSKTGRQAVGNVPEGTSPPISFQVTVPEDAENGSHRVPVHVSYVYTDFISDGDTYRDQSDVSRTYHVDLTVEDRAQFEVVDVESDANVGSAGTTSVTVENNGSIASRATQFSLASSSPEVTFSGSETGSQSAGRIEPGERRTINFSTTIAAEGESTSYPLTLSATYEDSDGTQYSASESTVSIAPDEQTFAVGEVTSDLQVGDDGELSGVLTNTGNDTVDDVVLTWAGEQQNVNPSESEYAIGSLEPGESAAFDFNVEISDAAREGPRQFSLVAEYENGQGNTLSSEPLNVRQEVGPSTDEFDVRLDSTNVSAGSSSTIELTLTNTAGEELTDIEAMLFADSPISADDDEEYVQSLADGESTTLVFGISAAGGALDKSYPLSMDFQYDEPDGDTVTSDTYRVPVTVTSPDGGGSPLGLVAGVVLLALVGVGAYMRFR